MSKAKHKIGDVIEFTQKRAASVYHGFDRIDRVVHAKDGVSYELENTDGSVLESDVVATFKQTWRRPVKRTEQAAQPQASSAV